MHPPTKILLSSAFESDGFGRVDLNFRIFEHEMLEDVG